MKRSGRRSELRIARAEAAKLRLLEDVVAAEHLVGALAGQDDLEALVAHQPGEDVQRRRRGPKHRPLRVPDDVGEDRADVGRPAEDGAMVGAERLRHLKLELSLVEFRIVEADREGPQPLRRELGRDRCDDGGVEPAGKIGADRHVGAKPDPRRIDEERTHVLRDRALVARVLAFAGIWKLKLPIGTHGYVAVARQQHMRRRQLANAFEDRARRKREPEREYLVERDRIERGIDARDFEERLCLRGEVGGAAVARVEERAHAHAVARQHHLPPARVPDSEGEVAVEPRDAVRPHRLVEADDHLGVGMRAETDAACDQLLPEFDVVEDLAVEGDPNRLVVVRHRLRAGGKIDDRKARMREAEAVAVACPLAVRAAMTQRREHPLEQPLGRDARVGHAEITSNSAHWAAPPRRET